MAYPEQNNRQPYYRNPSQPTFSAASPSPSQNNPQGPSPSQNNPTGPPPNPYGSMYSQGSGFNIGSRRSGLQVPQMGLGASAHNMDPRIKESLAKNAMIGDLFGGYSEWRDQGSPDLGNMWQRYLPVSRAYAGSEDVDFDRLRSQGDLRGLPSREDMLAQLGIGQQSQQPPQPPQQGQSDPRMGSDDTGQFPWMNRINPPSPSPSRADQNYQPWNADWVYNNVYGPGGWQPPGMNYIGGSPGFDESAAPPVNSRFGADMTQQSMGSSGYGSTQPWQSGLNSMGLGSMGGKGQQGYDYSAASQRSTYGSPISGFGGKGGGSSGKGGTVRRGGYTPYGG